MTVQVESRQARPNWEWCRCATGEIDPSAQGEVRKLLRSRPPNRENASRQLRQVTSTWRSFCRWGESNRCGQFDGAAGLLLGSGVTGPNALGAGSRLDDRFDGSRRPFPAAATAARHNLISVGGSPVAACCVAGRSKTTHRMCGRSTATTITGQPEQQQRFPLGEHLAASLDSWPGLNPRPRSVIQAAVRSVPECIVQVAVPCRIGHSRSGQMKNWPVRLTVTVAPRQLVWRTWSRSAVQGGGLLSNSSPTPLPATPAVPHRPSEPTCRVAGRCRKPRGHLYGRREAWTKRLLVYFGHGESIIELGRGHLV